MADVEAYARELFGALRGRSVVPPLSGRDPSLCIDDAYAISLGVLAARQAEGERVVGKKIGVTSKAVQDMRGVHQPQFGYLPDRWWLRGETIHIAAHGLIQPRAEAEIAFVLKDDLSDSNISAEQVVAATDYIAPCFEVVDSRIADWKIGIVDTVADNASCGVFVVGAARADPRGLDLAGLHVAVKKNGAFLSEGRGSAVQGSPAAAVAWLANTLGAYGVTLDAGDVILSGSLVPLEPARAGDVFEMELGGIGRCVARFV